MISREATKVLWFTVGAVAFAALVAFWLSPGLVKSAGLFLGLEGTALLASSLSMPVNDFGAPKGLFRKVRWYYGEGADLCSTVSYNPISFHGGLVLVAASLAIAAVS